MRIAIVNDVAIAAEAMRRVIALAPEHELAWIARDGVEAVENCARDRPELILMDLLMPRMDGVEATRRIMTESPCPIVVVTADINSNVARVFAAMGHGALDAVNTPLLGSGDIRTGGQPLLNKIRSISRLTSAVPPPAQATPAPRARKASDWLVAIGASAGGPAALAMILQSLPPTFPAPILIVQHVDARFAPGLADWLGQHSALPVKLASEGDVVRGGMVLVAGTDDHLVFKGPDRLGYSREPSQLAYRPSVDVMFQSVNKWWNGDVVAVLLTGMGADGAKGLKALRDAGHHTIAQDRATSAVYGMPKAAAALSAAVDILPLDRVAKRLQGLIPPVQSRIDENEHRSFT